MPRQLDSTTAAEVGKSAIRPVHLFTGYFQSGTVRLTDAAVSVDSGGYTWIASQFIGFSSAEETTELTVTRVTVSLSNVDLTAAAILANETYFNRRATIAIGFLNDALRPIASPVVFVDGRMDKPTISIDPDAGTCSASVDIVSWLEPMQSKRGRHTSDVDQQAAFPGDLGLSQVATIPPRIYWSDKFMKTGHQ